MLESCILDLEKLEGLCPSTNGCYSARCPVCALENKDKKRQHLSIQPDGVYNCAVDSLHNSQIFQLVGKDSDGVLKAQTIIHQPEIQISKTWNVEIIKCLVKDYSYWEGRGISVETCQKFDIGVAVRGQMSGRSVIPIFNKDKTKVIGFTGRKLDNNSSAVKWKHLGKVGEFIFPNTFNRESNNKILIVESPADSLYLYSQGITNTICLFGVKISGAVISYLIKSNPKEILIGTNNEISRIGNEAAEKIYETLSQFFNPDRVKIALPIGGKDFGEIGTESLNHWKKIFWEKS